MIIETSVENYLSIKDKIIFSLESSSSKRLLDNLIKVDEKTNILKSAAIYGANSSGKSNFIKSLFFIWYMVKNSHNLNIDAKIPRVPFKLNDIFLRKPSKFELIFIYNNIKYQYGFSCNEQEFIEEYLFYWPKGRKAQIFHRKNTTEYNFKIDRKRQELIKSQMNKNVLYLSRATQLGYDKTKDVYNFIINSIVINYSPIWADFTIKKIHEDEKVKQMVIEVLQKADFGGIQGIRINKEKKKFKGVELKLDKRGTYLNPIPIEEKEEDFYDIKFLHSNEHGKEVELNYQEESEGTKKTLAMLGWIFDILQNGKTVFIDEIEASLHPNIIKFLVKMFNNKNNKKAQLVFTTHNTNLLDNQLFRRDQIYICTKEPNKNTLMNSFLDYELREGVDFEKAYLDGRVGGLPFIDETFFDQKW
ncbi:MAG TPA: ATP-binding protein [Candidatus Nanoarchaeia archaeon]|nr:ATP-binding protein [Candidatus Nanoarchaeia archaeon]